MNTTELVKEIAEYTGQTQVTVSKVIKAAVEIITDELAKGESVRIADFGTFTAQHKPERIGHNPRTKEQLVIPAHNKAKFSEAKTLKEAINH